MTLFRRVNPAAVICGLCLIYLAPFARAVEATDAGGDVQLSFPPNTPLIALVTYVSDRAGINLIYEQSDLEQTFTLKSGVPIPESALIGLLESVLSTRALAIEDTGVPRVKRIVPIQQTSASGVRTGANPNASGFMTQVFAVRNLQADEVLAAVHPMLSKQGGTIAVLPEQNMLVVNDLAVTLSRIEDALRQMDVPSAGRTTRTIALQYGNAGDILTALDPLLQSLREKGPGRSVAAVADVRSNQLVVTGPIISVDQIENVLRTLDVPGANTQRVYSLDYVSSDTLDELIQSTLDDATARSAYHAAAIPNSGLLAVTGPTYLHEHIERLLDSLRSAMPEQDANPVRFYKLTNRKAADVLLTIRALEGKSPSSDAGQSLFDDGSASSDAGKSLLPLYNEMNEPSPAPASSADMPGSAPFGDAASSPLLGDALVAADADTNSIIVVGSQAQQQVYAALIAHLDQRRPQVLVEITIVTLDTTDNFTFGVDVGSRNGFNSNGEVISFSSFGVSKLNPTTGALAPVAASGGTLAILDPDVADVVIRALATETRSRLVSMPRILVNDNEEGKLSSASEVPYSQTIVTDTSTTTSAGGPAEAGTSITVTPHISEGDYIQLEYDLELSSFTAPAQPNLPPPSQKNTVASRVTIPDRYTIIVGGLNRKNDDNTTNKVPLLGDIPLVGNLFKSNTHNRSNQTLFVFIRPTVLRDDSFTDLKDLSSQDMTPAGLPPEVQTSHPPLAPQAVPAEER